MKLHILPKCPLSTAEKNNRLMKFSKTELWILQRIITYFFSPIKWKTICTLFPEFSYKENIGKLNFTLYGPETLKQLLWQTVKTQMICHIMRHFRIMRHFIRVFTVCERKSIFRDRNTIFFGNNNLWSLSIDNGPSWHNCIKLYGKYPWYKKGSRTKS